MSGVSQPGSLVETKPLRIVLVTDLDNTLYDFVDFFGPAFRGMVSALSRAANLNKADIIREAKAIYERYGSLEYAFLVDHLAVSSSLTADDMAHLVRTARGAFRKVRTKRLKLYPSVKSTLEWANSSGVVLCAVTNAPAYQAFRRLKQLHIAHLFRAVYAARDFDIPKNLSTPVEPFDWQGVKLQTIHLQDHETKPSLEAFSQIKKRWANIPTSFVMVGDNLARDLIPAAKAGMSTIWARYGTVVDAKNVETVLSVTPNVARKREKEDIADFTPDYTIDQFDEIRNILPIPKQLAFDAF